MNEPITLRIDLGINAQKIMQQVQIHNKGIEGLVEKGINDAIKEICEMGDLSLIIKQKAIEEFTSLITQRVLSWETKNAIMAAIDKKVGDKINEYAESIASKITDNLK